MSSEAVLEYFNITWKTHHLLLTALGSDGQGWCRQFDVFLGHVYEFVFG